MKNSLFQALIRWSWLLLLVVVVAACNRKKNAEKGQSAAVVCEFPEQEISLDKEKSVSKKLSCSIPVNQGQSLTIAYDTTMLNLQAEGHTGAAGNIVIQTPHEDEFSANLKIKALKVGKTTVKVSGIDKFIS